MADPLPNLIDRRPNSLWPNSPLFWYRQNAKGETVVGTSYSGLVKGFSSTGRRVESLEAAAAAVRTARALVVAQWTAKGWRYEEIN
jgi:hypothetical protein